MTIESPRGPAGMNNKIEILAPAGSLESLTAAVRSGADAVYIGLTNFSARAYADNFDEIQLISAGEICRLHGVKLHTAVNTLVTDDEIKRAFRDAQTAYLAGADAFIVQDVGLAMLIKQAFPDAELHSSTQLTVHTVSGAKYLEKLGFDRVVLAREMSRAEIEDVVKNVGIDTEVFVHGALCMCVSGQCELSAMLGGRSGNRGRCAQPCRLPFTVKGGTGYDLSLKDNSIIDRLRELEQIGVTSAKIEGRMKRPEYVAAAVRACRTAADTGSADSAQTERLKAVFSRSGFTDGYYTGRRGKSMFGTRSKEDVTAANTKLLSGIRNEYKDEVQTNRADITFSVKSCEPSSLTVTSRGHTVTVTGDVPQTANNAPLSAEKAASQLKKTGGTAFYAGDVNVDIDDGLTLPISGLNAMRRDALSKLTRILCAIPKRNEVDVEIPTIIPHRRTGKIAYRAVFPDCKIPEVFARCEMVFVPIFSADDDILRLMKKGFSVGVKLPRVMFGTENKVLSRLGELKMIGISDAYCANIGTAAPAAEHGFRVHGGAPLNIFNTQSLAFYENMGLTDAEVSFELTAAQINKLGGDMRRGIIAYGYLPLMVMRNCPNKNGAGCRTCGGISVISDRKGIDFTLMCDRKEYTELLNSEPLILSDKLRDFGGVDFMTFYFTKEDEKTRERIFHAYENGDPPAGKFTRGLYYRGVQ